MKNTKSNLYEHCIALLNERGVMLEDVVECSMLLQKKFSPHVKYTDYMEAVISVLSKREVQFTIMTAVALDKMVDADIIPDETLTEILKNDEPLYGIDEVLAYSICNLYGSIALTNFGFIDREKLGIIQYLNLQKNQCNTFIDDVVGAIAAAAAGSIAHNKT